MLLVVRRGLTAGAVILAVVTPLILSSAQASVDQDVAHPLTEAVRYSARPWMFYTPPLDNPLWGDRTINFVQRHLFDAPVYEQSLYIGLVLAILTLIGIWRWGGAGPVSEIARRSRFVLVSGAAVAGLITIGPYIPLEGRYYPNWADTAGIAKIPSLGLLMFKLGPMFRFFSRAFVFLLAFLVVLAAIGLTRVLRRIGPSTVLRCAAAGVVLLAIGLEFANQPPRVVMDLREPHWVAAVRALPDDAAVVDYPVVATNSPRSMYYLFWQAATGHPTANPFDKPVAQAFAAEIANPDLPSTGKALHDAGIRYAVVHTALPPSTTPPYQPGLPDDSMPRSAGSSNPWFEHVRTTDDAVIYRVRTPAEVAAVSS